MKTKEKDTKKSFDAVKFMREQRDRISKEIMNLTPEEIVENKKTQVFKHITNDIQDYRSLKR